MPLEAICAVTFEAMRTTQGGQYPTVAVTICKAVVTESPDTGGLALWGTDDAGDWQFVCRPLVGRTNVAVGQLP